MSKTLKTGRSVCRRVSGAQQYMAFAKKADEEGLHQVARLFRAAAQAEFIHAQNHLKAIEGIKTTAENLQEAIGGENYEVVSMYPPFIAEAAAEEAKRAKNSFEWAWEVEKCHEALYRAALADLGKEEEEYEYYVCPFCGYTHARSAPEKCPVCGAPASKFQKID